MAEIKATLLPTQIQFIKSQARQVMYSGGYGSGKSVSLCYKLLVRASKPGTREALVRKTMPALKRSTLKTLLEGDGKMPPVLPPGSYEYNKHEGTINIKNGGQIVVFSLDDPSKALSQNLSGVAIEEATELSIDDYNILKSRIRLHGIKYYSPQLYCVCNPASQSHHLYERFIGPRKSEDAEWISAPTTENWFLPREYVEDLNKTTGVYHRRYVDGEWCHAEGIVYDRFNRVDFINDSIEPDSYKRVICSIDPGFTHRTAILVVAQDKHNNLHVLDEWCHSGKINAEIINVCLGFRDQYSASEFVVDSAAPSLVEEMKRSGLNAKPCAAKHVEEGIRQVQQCFVIIDNKPRLTINSRCKRLISELETYSWIPGADKPLKQEDDAADSLRYSVVHMLHRRAVKILALGGSDTEEERPLFTGGLNWRDWENEYGY